MLSVARLVSVAVGLVFLIGCVNVGHLLLARGALRYREVAMRRALGATRFRVVRQLLTENLVLAVVGGICGVVIGYWTNEVLARSLHALGLLFPANVQLWLDWTLVAFAMGISLVTTIMCGVLPAWRTSQGRSVVDLRSDVSSGLKPRRRPFGLVAQVAMSLMLLMLSGTFLRAALQVQSADPGFAVEGRLFAHVFIPSSPFTPETGRVFYANALDRLRALPGVEGAAIAYTLPLAPRSRG